MPGAQHGPGFRGDTLEQPEHLLGSGGLDGTTARATNQAGSCAGARTLCGRAGQAGAGGARRLGPEGAEGAASLKPGVLPLGSQFASQPVLTAAMYCPSALAHVSTAVSASLGLSNAVG